MVEMKEFVRPSEGKTYWGKENNHKGEGEEEEWRGVEWREPGKGLEEGEESGGEASPFIK